MSDLSYPNDPAPRRPAVVPVLDSAGTAAELFGAARDGTTEGRAALHRAIATDAVLLAAARTLLAAGRIASAGLPGAPLALDVAGIALEVAAGERTAADGVVAAVGRAATGLGRDGPSL